MITTDQNILGSSQEDSAGSITKLDHVSLIPAAHTVEGEEQLLQVSSEGHTHDSPSMNK